MNEMHETISRVLRGEDADQAEGMVNHMRERLAFVERLRADCIYLARGLQHVLELKDKLRDEIHKQEGVIEKLRWQRVPQWVPIADKAPDEERRYLVYVPPCLAIAGWDGTDFRSSTSEIYRNVTHWAELPKQPTE